MPSDLPNDILPNYEVLDFIGRGGMGAVYKARQKSLNRLVAIKVLPRVLDDDEFNFAGRFKQEARAMAKLSHPAIIHVHDFGETNDGLLYFVMEFVDGTDVAAVLAKEGRLPAARAVEIAKAVCDALHYAHSRGVIHRDIKPANVLIDNERHIKVADFGLAKMNDPSQASGLTRTNVAMGTQEFAAPEMLTPGAAVDHRADIYSLGVMLYQMLTGEIPRMMFKLPSFRRPELGTSFDALICKALETDPNDRYQSALDLRHDLDAAATLTKQVSAPPAVAVIAPSQSNAPLLIATVVVIVLIASGWFIWKGSNGGMTEPPPPPVATEPGAMKLWDGPDKIPNQAGIKWEKGAVRLDRGTLAYSGLLSRDGILRAEILMNPDRSSPQITIRYRESGKGDRYSYAVSAHPKDGTIKLQSVHPGPWTVLKEWPLPRAFGPDEWLKLELRAVGEDVTVSADGKVLGTVHDTSRPEAGSVMLWAAANSYFRNVIFMPLDKAGAVQPAGRVIDLLPLVDVNRDAIEGRWSRTAAGLIVNSGPPTSNGMPRLQLPYVPSEEYDFEIEFTPTAGSGDVKQIVSAATRSFIWCLDVGLSNGGRKAGIETLDGDTIHNHTDGTVMRERLLTNGQLHRSRVEVRSDRVRGFLDNELLVEWAGHFNRLDIPEHSKMREALHLGLAAYGRSVTFHKIEVRELTGTRKITAAVGLSKP